MQKCKIINSVATISRWKNGMIVACLLGLVLSVYTCNVEKHLEEDENYTAMCDISEGISCTKVFGSKYGTGFGFMGPLFGEDSFLNQPNGVYGVVYYFGMLLLTFVSSGPITRLQMAFSGISVLLNVYLAYLLSFVLEDLCVVCVTLYVVNFATFYLSYRRYEQLRLVESLSKKAD